MENFMLMSQHFKKFMMTMDNLGWRNTIPSAGAANVPHLFDDQY